MCFVTYKSTRAHLVEVVEVADATFCGGKGEACGEHGEAEKSHGHL